MNNTIVGIVVAATVFLSGQPVVTNNNVITEANYSLTNRYSNTYVNDVFTDNILLTLAYLGGKVKKGEAVSWDTVKKPASNSFTLKPGESFAFHDTPLEKYKKSLVASTNAHFSSNEGFKSDGFLVGDGVCHLASFIYAVAKKAGLETEAPTNHDFAKIPDVPRELGVSIYYMPDNPGSSTLQNLYITNNFSKTIAFVFTHDKENLNIKVEELN